jgi:hypothetical protein
MSWLLDLRLISFFNVYLGLFFFLGTLARWRQYHTFAVLVHSMPGRWPRLMKLVGQYRHIFVTWGTVLPLGLMLFLWLANWVASTKLWPHADFTVAELVALWPALPVVALTGTAMVAFDVWGLLRAGRIDREQVEKYFDQAEYWLRSWAAPVVRVFTLGYVHPRRMVAEEVQKALVGASRLINSTLWWVCIQTGLRIAYGLSLWGTYLLKPWLERLVGGS